MAQLVFSAAGQTLGSSLLPNGISILGQQVSGAAIGQFVGSVAGAAVDSYLFAPRLEGPRVKDVHVTESREGASLPKVFGRIRVGGNVIWAAQFKEHKKKEGGGKGGPSQTTYSYSLSFAVGLCEGEISTVTRIWANGSEMDLSNVNWRVYKGSADQSPDALIESIEGIAPAYRGLAYIVFEDLPLDDYGMRMPQLSFEVVRPAARKSSDIPRLEDAVTSVNLIPGSGEFAYATQIVRRIIADGEETPENMHNGAGNSNFVASVDQLLDELPNVKHVNLIVGWFGSDLRCGECFVKPGVEISEKETSPLLWNVAGVERNVAYLISQDEEGRANYGGTPDDESVIQAISDLKSRGVAVTLYPFLFMDIPPDNGLADPYGADEQAVFPWRGRITCLPESDVTEAAGNEVDAFFGDVTAHDFQPNGYGGPDEWRYNRFILHYADLVQRAGGVHAFLIGAEMVGLSRIRSARGVYPAALHFKGLAAEVRSMLGNDCKISYAADWTEYGSYVPDDGKNDTDFPLDELWASPDIDFVGVDWYPPMSDWREIDGHADMEAGWRYLHDPQYLASNIEGGEGYDWYYAGDDDRANQVRTPINDGGYGEHWTYRQKDIRNWQANVHTPRQNGVKQSSPTAWVPASKPIRFVEFGCSAVDMGTNQPNVFYDPKSSENAFPHYSSGRRDDVIQRRALEAFCEYWKDDPLLDQHGISIWAWDARPFPAWPTRSDIWGDGDNWNYGHWLNGRVGLALLSDVITDLGKTVDIGIDTKALNGLVTGFVVDNPMSIRDAIEPLKLAYKIECVEDEDLLLFGNQNQSSLELDIETEVAENGRLNCDRKSMEASEKGVRLRYIDAEKNYLPSVALSMVQQNSDLRDVSLPLVLDDGQASGIADDLRQQAIILNESARFSLSLKQAELDCGDRVHLGEEQAIWRVDQRVEGQSIEYRVSRTNGQGLPSLAGTIPPKGDEPIYAGAPFIGVIDGPPLPDQENDTRPLIYGHSKPWGGQVDIQFGAAAELLSVRGSLIQPSVTGRLTSSLSSGSNGRWFNQSFDVKLDSGTLESASTLAVLNGQNALLVETEIGWELLQFRDAELIGEQLYRVGHLLRALQGTDKPATQGANIGSRVLLLDQDVARADLKENEVGLDLLWKARSVGSRIEATRSGEFVWQQRALKQWPPVHLHAEEKNGNIEISWIRRSRIGSDSWGEAEPEMETDESYQLSVFINGALVRQWETIYPHFTYDSSSIVEDLPNGGEIHIGVKQLGKKGLFGQEARTSVII